MKNEKFKMNNSLHLCVFAFGKNRGENHLILCFTLCSFVLIGFSKWRKQQLKAKAILIIDKWRGYLYKKGERRRINGRYVNLL